MILEKLFDGKGKQYNADSEKIGDLNQLETEAKNDVVSALNELDAKIPETEEEDNGAFLRVYGGELVFEHLADVSLEQEKLTAQVLMPGEDYQAICEVVKAKTGKTENFKSGDLAKEIEGIEIKVDIDEELESLENLIDAQSTKIEELSNILEEKATAANIIPQISVDSVGLITATAGSKTATYQLAFQPAKTITPRATSQIAVSGNYYTGGGIVVAGDANLKSENIKYGVSIFGITGTNTAEVDMLKLKLDGTLTEYIGEGIATVPSLAFTSCSELTRVEFPDCITIANGSNYSYSYYSSYGYTYSSLYLGAFANCYSLSLVYFPKCVNIGRCAFAKCKSLTFATSQNFPECTNIENYAFYGCTTLSKIAFSSCSNIGYRAFALCSSLSSVSLPYCKVIGGYAFQYCYALSSITLSQCTSLGTYAFDNCSSLGSVTLSRCTQIGRGAFASCSSLSSITLPVCSSIQTDTFDNCTQLRKVSLPACTFIGTYAFEYCFRLSYIYLTNSSVCTLSNSNAFSSTPYAGYSSYFSGTPRIYVPSSLVSTYRTATNWTYFSKYIYGY